MKQALHIFILLSILAWSPVSTMVCSAKKKAVTEVRDQASIQQEQELKYYFYAMLQLSEEKRYDEVFALLQHCQQLAPNDPAVNYYLSILYAGLGKQTLARTYCDKAYAGAPKDYWQLYVNMHIKASTERDKMLVIKALKQECKAEPDKSDAYEYLQKIYINDGDFKSALKMQDQIEKIEGPTPYGAMQRIDIYDQMGKRKQARAAAIDYLKYEPDNYYFQTYLADMYLQDGDREGAWREYEKIRRTYPDNPYLNQSLSEYYGRGGDKDKAAEYLMKAIEDDQLDLNYKQRLLKSYTWLSEDSMQLRTLESLATQYPQEESALYALSQRYLSDGDKDKAQPLLWTIIDINPTNETVWQNLLTILQEDTTTKHAAELEPFLRKAIHNMPTKGLWYSTIALCKVEQEQKDSAIYYCQQGLLNMDEQDIRAKFSINSLLGDLFAEADQLDSAYAHYEAALKIDPENLYLLNNYAYYLSVNGGDLRKAEKMSQITIKRDAHNPTYLDTYAWILHLEGQDILARFYMQQAWDLMDEKHRNEPEIQTHYQEILGK